MSQDHDQRRGEKAVVSEEVRLVRRAAGQLLRQLMVDRDLSEQRRVERGEKDPFKTVTGHTALEEAIDLTRDMIRDIDEIGEIGELGELGEMEPAPARLLLLPAPDRERLALGT